jgi:uncharacterized protein YlxW (UPF0749 family)
MSGRRSRSAASMGLLDELVAKSLDPGYAAAAARRPSQRSPGARLGRSGLNLLLAVTLGFATAAAVGALRVPHPSEPSTRNLLEREILDRSAQADELTRTNESLSAEISQIQTAALSDSNPELLNRLREAELLSGAITVEGPGVVIVLQDGPGADAGDLSARVQDVDVQLVTNALWAAGAEAIAVNGQRLTSLSAIRGAGEAILVDLAPLIPPYRIEAIGDPKVVQNEFARSAAANHLAFLSGTYGISVTTTSETNLTLPGAGSTTLRYAQRTQ